MFDVTAPAFGQSKERPFPSEILPRSIKSAIWIELTSLWEENMTIRYNEKDTGTGRTLA